MADDDQHEPPSLVERPPSARETLIVRSIAAAVFVVGATALALFVAFQEDTPREAHVEDGALVEVLALQPSAQELFVRAQGSVVPAQKISLSAEVAGRVTWVSKDFVPGAHLDSGAPMVRIDSRDFALRAAQARASLAQARNTLQIEKARKSVAEREWSMIGSDTASAEGRAVALREPQLRAAEAAVEVAEKTAELANLQLTRSEIRAPFASFVQAVRADLGQIVGPQTPIAALVGTNEFWVQVAVPLEVLDRIKIPGWNAEQGEGSTAVVSTRLGDSSITREGFVTGLMGDLDPVGRMAKILVTILDPFDLKGADDPARLPLLVGSYVDVEINTGTESGLLEVPRAAVFEGNKIFVFGDDSRLQLREVDIAWARPDSLLVSGGLKPGDRVIVSRVPKALPGMKLRLAEPTGDARVPPGKGSGVPLGTPAEAERETIPVSGAPRTPMERTAVGTDSVN